MILLVLLFLLCQVTAGLEFTPDFQAALDVDNARTKSWVKTVEGVLTNEACEILGIKTSSEEQLYNINNQGEQQQVGIMQNYGTSTSLIGTTCYIQFYGDDGFVQLESTGTEVEADGMMWALELPKSWGLDRVDQRELPLDSSYITHWNGTGVDIYVLDTGINKDHVEFGGRANHGAILVDEEPPDANGHGTHCAGTAAGATLGIARNATVWGVKVLSAGGSGSFSNIIKGIEFVVRQQRDLNNNATAIINLSLGGRASTVIDSAVKAATAMGHIVVIASGNSNSNACKKSPSRLGGNGVASGIITVGATTIVDKEASFSNWGSCVDILAPGLEITSAYIGSKNAVKTLSGTSMAAPHVSGVMAQLLEKNDGNRTATLEDFFELVINDKIVLKSSTSGTPNKGLYMHSTETSAPTPPTLAPTPLPEAVIVASDQEWTPKEANYGGSIYNLSSVCGTLATTNSSYCTDDGISREGSVVVVQRGDCNFLQKTRVAQKNKANALIVVQNTEEASFIPRSPQSDDTTDITIPTVMLNKTEGTALLEYIGTSTCYKLTDANTTVPPTLHPTVPPTLAPTGTKVAPQAIIGIVLGVGMLGLLGIVIYIIGTRR